ncbi:DUF2252 family protein [Dyadobacter sp. 3J3]|uniref:DUF2252 family protein n=1 Tax=Dyadobacter sp. 3J3 TaxID=2606600 RepID=UPI00135A40B0|nr:DUF2252 family protein [Dyadobacter sp. 3J3]
MKNNVFTKIKEFNKGRDPFFLALKYDKMMENPFNFFRGTCHLFYQDLSKKFTFEDDTKVWICGDLHIENFGRYRGSDAKLHYDIEDFDEAVLAPVTWEILRVITSIHLAAEQLKSDTETADLSFEKSKTLSKHFLESYVEVILEGVPGQIKCTNLLNFITPPVKNKNQVFQTSSTPATINIDRPTSNKSKTDELDLVLKKKITEVVTTWLRGNKNMDEVIDAAWRIAGTGSLGIERYIVLVKQTDGQGFYLLDMKRSMPSSLRTYVDSFKQKIVQPEWQNESERIIEIQEKMQDISPQFIVQNESRQILFEGNSYVLKELQPEAGRIELKNLVKANQSLKEIIADYAIITASAHLSSADFKGSSSVRSLQAFFKNKMHHRSILNYCTGYAKDVKKDFADFSSDPNVWHFIRKYCELVKIKP